MPDLDGELDLIARLRRRADDARERRGERVPARRGDERIAAADDACYAVPAFLARVLDADEVDRLRGLLVDLKAANDELIGERAADQWVLLNGDAAALAWNAALLAWIERYVERRLARPNPRDRGEPFLTFLRLLDELFPWLEELAHGGVSAAATVHRHYVAAAADRLGWLLLDGTWGRQVRFSVGPTETNVDWGSFPVPLMPVAHEVLSTLHWYPDSAPERLVRALGGPDPENADERLEDLAADIAEMRPLIVRGFEADRTVVQVGPDVFAAWSWNVGHRVGSIVTAATEGALRDQIAMAMGDQIVNVAFSGAVCDRYLPWRTFGDLEGGRAAAMRLLEPLYERLFAVYAGVDIDAIVRPTADPADEPDTADAVVAASCAVLRRKAGRGRNQSLGIRTTELFAVLQRLGCEIRPGKGSEIAIYRPGARIWTLTHHKRNPRVGWATVRRMLERLQIPMETWLTAVR